MDFKTKKLAEFQNKFKCFQKGCDGNGNIHYQNSDGEWEAKQCQLHAEYLFPIKQFISDLIDECEKDFTEEDVKKIRLDTLRQVLPDIKENKPPNLLTKIVIEKFIKDKAEYIWGLEINNY